MIARPQLEFSGNLESRVAQLYCVGVLFSDECGLSGLGAFLYPFARPPDSYPLDEKSATNYR